MGWTVRPAGEWSVAVTDNPATDLPAALALPQTWQWKDSKSDHIYVHKSQVANLTAPTGPPVAGYTAWYDASQITGQADNTPLNTWPDLSGNGFNMFQQGTPTYYSSTAGKTINGKPAVWFGGGVYMFTSVNVVPPGSLFLIAAVASLADVEALVSSQSGGIELRVNSGKLDALKQGQVDIASSTGSVPLAPFFAGLTYDGAHVVFYINSATQDSSVAASAVLSTVRLALAGAGADPLTGPIAEAVLYPSALTGPQISATYGYLKTKWGTP